MKPQTTSDASHNAGRCDVGRLRAAALVLAVACLLDLPAAAQQYRPGVSNSDMYQPLHHGMPPGQVAAWLQAIRECEPCWMQPLRVELPSDGTVSVFSASQEPAAVLAPPAQFSASIGHVYRLRLADMPEFPGVEIYPTVEVLDRLHPPAGRENDYPIPIVFTENDLRIAVSGHMVTRVVYLEQPQLAAQIDPLRREVPLAVGPDENALLEADRLGRPMLIVRIGGRVPSVHHTPASFYGTGGAVDASWAMSRPDTPVADADFDRTAASAALSSRPANERLTASPAGSASGWNASRSTN